jgi:cytochrome c biogenesis protein CcdA
MLRPCFHDVKGDPVVSIPLVAARSSLGVPARVLLFVLAVGLGTLGGYGWSLELSDVPYDAMLQVVLEPGFQVASLTLAVALGFTLGFAHIFRICYLPAAFAVMPLLEAARDKRDLLRTAAVLMLSMVLICALWGAIVGMPAAALAGTVGSVRVMSMIMQPVLTVMGLLMLLVALGELGLIRRLLPDFHVAENLAQDAATLAERSSYRPVLILAISMAATFGIVCSRPLYLALLVYVAMVGGMGYGALTLGAYGLGLSSSVVLAGLLLIPAGRLTRLTAWLADRGEALHLVQGLAFAFMGALSVSWFLLRYVVPAA